MASETRTPNYDELIAEARDEFLIAADDVWSLDLVTRLVDALEESLTREAH
jgi:hypothetical protein